MSHYIKLILIILISSFFKKKKIESSFLADHGAAILRICKNAAVWLAEKVILIHFVRINKLDVFTGHLPAEN